MHRVVVARASKRGESTKDCNWLFWLSDRQAQVMAGEFGHDGEAGIKVVDIDFRSGELTGAKTPVKRVGEGRALEEVGTFPDCDQQVSDFPWWITGRTDIGRAP